jgi:hypothetical protein
VLPALLFTPPPHAFFPLQLRAQELPAQLIMPAHDLESAHAISQLAALLQSIPPAQPPCPHVILQATRDGQATTEPQVPGALQSITHVPSA